MMLRGVAALAAVVLAAPADEPVPVEVQALMFKRIFFYDKAIDPKEPRVLVVYGPEEADDAESVLDAFHRVGVGSVLVRSAELPDELRATAVYVMPGANTLPVRQLCAKSHVLSIGGAPAMAADGAVSVALGRTADGKPQIFINLRRAREEQQEFSAELLRLSKLL